MLGLHCGAWASLVVARGLVVLCEILFPRPGVEPRPPALGAWSLNYWPTREVPTSVFKNMSCKNILHILGVNFYFCFSETKLTNSE